MTPVVQALAAYRDFEPAHAELALALAGELREVDAQDADARLARLAERVSVSPGTAPRAQLEQIGAIVLDHVKPPGERPADDSDLMLDTALASGCGQPVVAAVLAAEIGRRCGVNLGIVSDGRRHFVAHRALTDPVVIDLGRRRGLRHPEELRADLSWHCAHQVCCAMLQALLARALERGDLAWALRLAELKLALPFDSHTRRHALSDLAALQAQLN